MERINRLKWLYAAIKSGKPKEILYGLGEGSGRTDLIITRIGGEDPGNDRINSAPIFRIYVENNRTLLDITDSHEREGEAGGGYTSGYVIRGLEPTNIAFCRPENFPDDLGALEIDLADGSQLAISHYRRAE